MANHDLSGFDDIEGNYTFNMSIETLRRMNNILIFMNTCSIQSDFNNWRIACEALANELSAFFDDLDEDDINALTKCVQELNDTQMIYNNMLENGESSGEIVSNFRTCITNYDRKLRQFMKDLKLLMHKGEDMGSLMGRQYK